MMTNISQQREVMLNLKKKKRKISYSNETGL